MNYFRSFHLDKEKDIIVDLYMENGVMFYVLRTPNHGSGNLITNLAKLCDLPLSEDARGLRIIKGTVPCYIDGYNRTLFIFRLGNTKVANIYPDGTVEMKASVPAISKTLMSQTKDYRLDIGRTIVKTYIRSECKFRTDLHTHMNANLSPDILIALGICHEIRYPLYYIKKLGLRLTKEQEAVLTLRRAEAEETWADCGLTGKYLTRRIDDNTFLNFADLILNNLENAAYNIPKIRASLAIMKDGQAVFTNLEKVYLYRYVFTKGVRAEDPFVLRTKDAIIDDFIDGIPDEDIRRTVKRIRADRENPKYRENSIFQDKLLWIARSFAASGIRYAEISDTTLVKKEAAANMLAEVHAVMPSITKETGVLLRFLAAIRRIPLTIVKDAVTAGDYFRENLAVLEAVAQDPYVAGSDVIGEEINDIRDVKPVLQEIVRIAAKDPDFAVRIHAGENDSLRDNVANSIACVRESLAEGQPMPHIRIGHGLYTADLKSAKGRQLIRDLSESGAVLEFQITSNVRLNNLSSMRKHPLRQYLRQGIRCVQGTDGGALYGTDSIDEQLTLEKMLGLSFEELCRMRECEDEVLVRSLAAFERKRNAFEEALRNTEEKAGINPRENAGRNAIAAYYENRIRAQENDSAGPFLGDKRLVSQKVLADRIAELPQDKFPYVICGGSFNNDKHRTVLRKDDLKVLDHLLETADPEKVFFVVGDRICGYEKYIVDKAAGRFQVFSIIPLLITEKEEQKLRKSGVAIRVSIEPSAMGLYKSFAYEIFKRRESVLIALDGNAACANMIQDAKNAKYKCRIYVSSHSRVLRAKAASLEGYVKILGEEGSIQAP